MGRKGRHRVQRKTNRLDDGIGSATYSTIANKLQVQAKAGLKIFGRRIFWAGGQIHLATDTPGADKFYRMVGLLSRNIEPQTKIATMRVGAHISAISFGPVLIGVSGGWVHDQQLGIWLLWRRVAL